MKNKPLEMLLKKNKQRHLIKLLEKCEKGRIIEIKVIREELMTNIAEVDNDVINYLAKLNVKLTFVKAADIYKSKNKFYKEPPKCSHVVHDISRDKAISKDEKLKLFEQLNLKMFRIDEKSYVCCPDCSKITTIIHS